MKQDTLQSLLEKYREGALTDSERLELERLSHKEEVFAAAHHQATGILRRRVALGVSALMICGAGIWAVLPGGGNPTPQVAEVTTPIPEASQEVHETMAPASVTATAPLVAEIHETTRPAATARKARPANAAPVEKPAIVASPTKSSNDPVVMCNNQCDADSVINDIKKFLSV